MDRRIDRRGRVKTDIRKYQRTINNGMLREERKRLCLARKWQYKTRSNETNLRTS